ncbi:unnamed protein product [Callosobruchus maculatus]|uniref:Uncharacterized protein n=1 Tax=Callosobruchus maculatus TaxID=64391 RepID=A0A653CUJ9_CALMS|nr:unnamed protein product [Callosobruchus maculatus]
MSLPVSQYEALLAEVRGLRRKAQRVQQLARPLVEAATDVDAASSSTVNHRRPQNIDKSRLIKLFKREHKKEL